MKNKWKYQIEIYQKAPKQNRVINDIINLINKEYDKLSYPEKIIWDCASIYNDEFIMPMRIYGKAIDMNEYDTFCKELVLNLKNQGFF